LQLLLQLEAKEVTRLVLRLPSLLVYAPSKLAVLYEALQQLLDGAGQEQQHTRQLVLKWPQVGWGASFQSTKNIALCQLCPVPFS
jgi:hypothetical protein